MHTTSRAELKLLACKTALSKCQKPLRCCLITEYSKHEGRREKKHTLHRKLSQRRQGEFKEVHCKSYFYNHVKFTRYSILSLKEPEFKSSSKPFYLKFFINSSQQLPGFARLSKKLSGKKLSSPRVKR